jgi:hypothetical protein
MSTIRSPFGSRLITYIISSLLLDFRLSFIWITLMYAFLAHVGKKMELNEPHDLITIVINPYM